MKKIFATFFILCNVSVAFSQSVNVIKTDAPVKIDGVLDEPVWQMQQSIATDFTQNFPTDTAMSKSKTEVKVCFDSKYLYVAAKCYDIFPGRYIIQSYRRDFENKVNDMFVVTLNPSGDKLNGFNFSVSPLNVQREGTIEEGGFMGVTTAWDTKWFSATKKYDGYWIAEMAIPFKNLRYNENVSNSWGINFSRNDLKCNEVSCWIPVKKNYNISSLSSTAPMKFSGGKPPIIKDNLVLIPFVYHQYSTVNTPTGNVVVNKPSGGLDAKVGLNSSMNMDITFNPDFSQVEVDRQVTNLSRFSIFYPERRNFFIENGDLFARFGFSRIRPFFSRRIGLDDNGNVVPILYGLKISGKPQEDWRIGLLSTQTLKTANNTAQNYFVGAAQVQTFGRSNLGVILMNRNGMNHEGTIDSDYNRIVGADYNINSLDNRWRGKVFLHHSLYNRQQKDANATAMWLGYTYNHWDIEYNHEYVGENYRSDVGFVYRKNYFRHEDWINYYFFPKSKVIFQHGPTLYGDVYLDKQGHYTDYTLSPGYKIIFKSGAVLQYLLNDGYVKLINDFDPSGKNSPQKLLAGTEYHVVNSNMTYTSDGRKLLRYTLYADYGQYYNGTKLTYSGDISYRFPPFASVGINFEQNRILLPQPYNSNVLNLLGTRVDFTFTRKIFFTTYLQYNSQTNNVNINNRLQWRFAPVSDFYIVYTTNYTANNFSRKNQYLILKLSYWLGL